MHTAQAVTLHQLTADRHLTPKKFAGYFERFRFELHHEVQPITTFLANRTGDCDDYACLADEVLPAKGYETRLVHVRMADLVAHAVCYVSEDRVYLDYNNRAVWRNLVRSKPSIREIANKVARSLNANWTSASEYVYSYEFGRKLITATVVKTTSPDADPPAEKAPIPAQFNRFYVE